MKSDKRSIGLTIRLSRGDNAVSSKWVLGTCEELIGGGFVKDAQLLVLKGYWAVDLSLAEFWTNEGCLDLLEMSFIKGDHGGERGLMLVVSRSRQSITAVIGRILKRLHRGARGQWCGSGKEEGMREVSHQRRIWRVKKSFTEKSKASNSMGAVIISSKLTNRNEIFNDIRLLGVGFNMGFETETPKMNEGKRAPRVVVVVVVCLLRPWMPNGDIGGGRVRLAVGSGEKRGGGRKIKEIFKERKAVIPY
ncbi:hypothetical protein Tco_1216630 [Tanacetum coccineum]